MKSEFPGNMYMYKICPKYQQSFKKVHAAVLEELLWQTVHYYIQYGDNILSTKGTKF